MTHWWSKQMSHWWWSSQRKPLHMIQWRHPLAASPSPSRPATRCCWTPPGPPHQHSRSGYLSLTLTKSSSTWKIVNYHYQAQYFETFGGWLYLLGRTVVDINDIKVDTWTSSKVWNQGREVWPLEIGEGTEKILHEVGDLIWGLRGTQCWWD